MVPIRGGTKGKRHVHIKLLRRTVHTIKKTEDILLIKESRIFKNSLVGMGWDETDGFAVLLLLLLYYYYYHYSFKMWYFEMSG